MKTGRSLSEIAAELERQRESRRDYLAQTRALVAEPATDGALTIAGLNGGAFGVTDYAHSQLAEELSIPKPYYDRMRTAAPELLANNVNHWLHAEPKRRLVRTLDGNVRAFLSDKFRPLDNIDLAEAALPVLVELGAEIRSAELTERRLYIKASLPGQALAVPNSRRVGDLVEMGLSVSNSEVGAGAVSVDPFAFFLACLNGAMRPDSSMRKYHVGRRQAGGEGEDVREMLSDATKRLDDAAFWAKVGDVVRGAFRKDIFARWVAKLGDATGDKLEGDPAKAVEVTAVTLGLSERSKVGVLRHLIEGGDLSRYGLMNAVTRTAEDVDDYEEATELERAGARVIELPAVDWRAIAQAA